MHEIGPYIIFSHVEGDFELAIEACLKRIAISQGIPLFPEVCDLLKRMAKEEADKIKESIRKKGVPPSLEKLFNLDKKKEVEKFVKDLSIPMEDISSMVNNCDMIGYSHKRYHNFFYPDDVIPTKIERKSFSAIKGPGPITNKNAKKFAKKIVAQFKLRKYISGHLFERDEQWHLIYFDFNDLYAPEGENHYAGGPHIHYISYLWGSQVNKADIWNKLETRSTKIPSIHIKCKTRKIE